LGGWGQHTLYLALDTSMLWEQYCVIRISLIYRGRAIPLVWQVIEHASSSIAYQTYQNLLDMAATLLPRNCEVVFLADRGFADTALMTHATRLGWHWRIRIKSCFVVYRRGQRRLKLSNYALKLGQAHFWQHVQITDARHGALYLALAHLAENGERWLVVSDEPTSLTTLDEYGLRFDIDGRYLDDYARFWFRGGGDPRSYSFWAADAYYARHLVQPVRELLTGLLDDLRANFATWEETHRDPNSLFWQVDDRDGMEMGIGGTGYRPSINAYLFGDAVATAEIAALAGRPELVARFRAGAERIKQLVQDRLWDPEAQFFKTIRRGEIAHVDVRELIGYTPWYFGLPDPIYAVAWRQLMDPRGFYAPYGPTTAEQRHPRYRIAYEGHECLWDGPSWPYATAQALTGLAWLLHTQEQAAISRRAYFDVLRIYTRSQRFVRDDGRLVSWIDEDINPYTGDWIARTRLKTWENGTWSAAKGGRERGKDYNHSTYCDLVITGLVGLRPRPDDAIEVDPLLPPNLWDYFCLDHVRYHGRTLSILWDRTGERFGRGPGLRLYADGEEIARRPELGRLVAT
jgi:hypothetical protein